MRLGRPVNGSCRAARSRARSASTTSVTSRTTESTSAAEPAGPCRNGVVRRESHLSEPSAARTRYRMLTLSPSGREAASRSAARTTSMSSGTTDSNPSSGAAVSPGEPSWFGPVNNDLTLREAHFTVPVSTSVKMVTSGDAVSTASRNARACSSSARASRSAVTSSDSTIAPTIRPVSSRRGLVFTAKIAPVREPTESKDDSSPSMAAV